MVSSALAWCVDLSVLHVYILAAVLDPLRETLPAMRQHWARALKGEYSSNAMTGGRGFKACETARKLMRAKVILVHGSVSLPSTFEARGQNVNMEDVGFGQDRKHSMGHTLSSRSSIKRIRLSLKSLDVVLLQSRVLTPNFHEPEDEFQYFPRRYCDRGPASCSACDGSAAEIEALSPSLVACR